MHLVIVGAGRLGTHLVGLVRKARHTVVVIEQDPEKCQAAAEAYDVMAIRGDASTREALEKAKAGQADAVVVTCRSPGVALAVSVLVRKMGAKRVLAFAQREEHREVLEEAGVLALESPEALAAERLFWWLQEPRVRDILRLAEGRVEVFEAKVDEGTAPADRTVADLQEKTGARVACIRRGAEWLLPLPGTDLKGGDRLTLFAEAEKVEKVLKHLQARKGNPREK